MLHGLSTEDVVYILTLCSRSPLPALFDFIGPGLPAMLAAVHDALRCPPQLVHRQHAVSRVKV